MHKRYSPRAAALLLCGIISTSCAADTVSVTPTGLTVKESPTEPKFSTQPTVTFQLTQPSQIERLAVGDITDDDLSVLILKDSTWDVSLSPLIGSASVIIDQPSRPPTNISASIAVKAGWTRAWRTTDGSHEVIQEMYLPVDANQTDVLVIAWTQILISRGYEVVTDTDAELYGISNLGPVNFLGSYSAPNSVYKCGTAAIATNGTVVTGSYISRADCNQSTAPWAVDLATDAIGRANAFFDTLG